MKTLYPVDKETYAKIGKAYLICADYPEVFGDVTYKKFCSMFVDVIDDDEDERDARKRALAPEMYLILQEIRRDDLSNVAMSSQKRIRKVLYAIDGEEAEA